MSALRRNTMLNKNIFGLYSHQTYIAWLQDTENARVQITTLLSTLKERTMVLYKWIMMEFDLDGKFSCKTIVKNDRAE